MVTLARTVIGTVIMVFCSALCGYLFTKRELWHHKLWYRFVIVTMYLNAGIIPTYLNMNMLGLTNNFLVYILPCIMVPYNLILVKTYIESIPQALEESAELDGAGYFVRFTRIILPLCKPILATIAIFGAVNHWNSLQDSLIMMQGNPQLFTLQHRLYIYLNQASNLQAMMQSGGAITQAAPIPTSVVTMGVTRISIFVSLLTIFPASAAIMATNSTARGPPACPRALQAYPTVARENRTSGGACRAYPMATAMAAPLIKEAIPPMVYPTPLIVISWAVRKPTWNWFPIVFRIVPISREQNSP